MGFMANALRKVTPRSLKSNTLPIRLFFRFRLRVVAYYFPRFFALNELDKALKKYLDYRGGYFVELGANDGVSQSNTKHFELFMGWSGVLVEPEPNNYEKCKRFRSRKSQIFNAACVSFSYEKNEVQLIYSNLMTIAVEGESDIADREEHAKIGMQFLEPGESNYSFSAYARTLNSILLEAGSPTNIDLLSLDVEGAELDVLKGIDHQIFRFRFILIESRSLDTIEQFLGALGYSLVEQLTGHDFLFRDLSGC